MINQITKIRMPSGDEIALVDWSARPLYSNVDLLTGFTDQQIFAFNYTEGETVSFSENMPVASQRVASLRDTNISGRSEMDSTEEYLVYEIKVEPHQWTRDTQTGFFNTGTTGGLPIINGPNLSLLQNRLILELDVSQKAFPQAGLGWFNQGFGPVVAVASTAAVRTYANQGVASHDASHSMPIPVHIGGTEDYMVILTNGPNAPGQTGNGAVTFVGDTASSLSNSMIQLRIYLCGLHKRATA